ncbi:MAG: hypothetical protein WBO55_12080 [Rhizobiaceae bacterium]
MDFSWIAISFTAIGGIAVAILATLDRLLPPDLLNSAIRMQTGSTRTVRQLGGTAIIFCLIFSAIFMKLSGSYASKGNALLHMLSGAIIIWCVGLIDDMRQIQPIAKLAFQTGTGLFLGLMLAPDIELVGGALPPWLRALFIALAFVSFMNMVNFMDGLDLMTAIGSGIPLLGASLLLLTFDAGDLAGQMGLVCVAALAGFSLFNLPPARMYLGDNGSLLIGFCAAYVALHVWSNVSPVAAVLLFLYYFIDTATSLVLRWRRGDNLLQPHAEHAYQHARKAGWSEWRIVGRVAVANSCLAMLAFLSADARPGVALACAMAGLTVAVLLVRELRADAQSRSDETEA